MTHAARPFLVLVSMMFAECCQCTRPGEISAVGIEKIIGEEKDNHPVGVEALKVATQEPREETLATPIKFKTMPGHTIGVRTQPAFFSPRTGAGLHGEFDVIEISKGDKGQRYLRLADGRGWAFTRSLEGDLIAHPVEGDSTLGPHDVDLDVEPGLKLAIRVPGGELKHVAASWRPLGLVYNVPPKEPAFEITAVEGHADEAGILAGWTLLGVGDVELHTAEDAAAADKLVAALPVQMVLMAGPVPRVSKTVLVSRRPLGMEFSRKRPFSVSVVAPGSHAEELGISLGMLVSRIGGVAVKKPGDVEKALAEFDGLPFDQAKGQAKGQSTKQFTNSGLPCVVQSADGKTEKTVFLQSRTMAFSFQKSPPFAVSDAKPSAKALGIENRQCVKSVGNVALVSAADVDKAMALVATLDDFSQPPPKGCCVLM